MNKRNLFVFEFILIDPISCWCSLNAGKNFKRISSGDT